MLNSRFFWTSVCVLTWIAVLAGMFAPKAVVDPFEVKQFDKLLHSVALISMIIPARYALPRMPDSLFWAVTILWAFALEALQPIVQPTREFNWMDVSANLVGVVIAALVLWLIGLVKRGP